MKGGIDQPNHRRVVGVIDRRQFTVIRGHVMILDVLMILHDVMVCVLVGVRRRNRLPEGQADRKHDGREDTDRCQGSEIMAVVRGRRQRRASGIGRARLPDAPAAPRV